MKPDTRSELTGLAKTGGMIVAAASALGLAAFVQLPSAPTAPPSVTLKWDCPTAHEQTFQFVRRTNLAGPWQFYTNIVGTNRATFPRLLPMEFWTIRCTWVTTNTNQIIYQQGF